MNGVIAIYQKELATYFRSPIAYFVIAVFLLGTGYFFIYNIFMTGVGTMDETFQNIGFVLLGMACLAIGQFFSALTQNQIVAALITIPVLLAFWFVGYAQGFQGSDALRSLLGYVSFSQHFGDFIRGLVRTEAVAFYLVVSAIALTLNTSYLKWQR